MSENLPVAAGKGELIARFAQRYGIDEKKVVNILTNTAFKAKNPNGEPISMEQLAALMIVADQYGLNPFTREIYAFPDKRNGIVPVVGVDGWLRIINNHPAFDGMDFFYPEEMVQPEDGRECPAWIEVKMYHKQRSRPTVIREYLDEVYRAPFINHKGEKSFGPWQTHTKRFLRHKGIIQAARVAFGFGGIYDEDEAEGFIDVDFKQLPGVPSKPFEVLLQEYLEVAPGKGDVDGTELLEFIKKTAAVNRVSQEALLSEAIKQPDAFWSVFMEWTTKNTTVTESADHKEPEGPTEDGLIASARKEFKELCEEMKATVPAGYTKWPLEKLTGAIKDMLKVKSQMKQQQEEPPMPEPPAAPKTEQPDFIWTASADQEKRIIDMLGRLNKDVSYGGFVKAVNFYGVSMEMGEAKLNAYVNSMLSATEIEQPGYLEAILGAA